MKNVKGFTMAAIIAVMLTSCLSSNVHTDSDTNADLTKYKSFKFVDGDDESGPNPLYRSTLIDNAIHAEIAIEMDKRGLVEQTTNPDLLVAYHTFTEKKQSSINNYYPMMYGGWGWRFYPWGFSPYPYGYWNGYNEKREYTEGTLIIDVIDATSKQLVWRGSISEAINDPSDLHKRAINAVQAIFKKYPVPPLRNGSREPVASRL